MIPSSASIACTKVALSGDPDGRIADIAPIVPAPHRQTGHPGAHARAACAASAPHVPPDHHHIKMFT
ncbi:MAG: hypothetical protein R3D56_15125 [Paracoccaceae bacterium]